MHGLNIMARVKVDPTVFLPCHTHFSSFLAFFRKSLPAMPPVYSSVTPKGAAAKRESSATYKVAAKRKSLTAAAKVKSSATHRSAVPPVCSSATPEDAAARESSSTYKIAAKRKCFTTTPTSAANRKSSATPKSAISTSSPKELFMKPSAKVIGDNSTTVGQQIGEALHQEQPVPGNSGSKLCACSYIVTYVHTFTDTFEEKVQASLCQINSVLGDLVRRTEAVESEVKGLKSTGVTMSKKTPTRVKVALIVRVSTAVLLSLYSFININDIIV